MTFFVQCKHRATTFGCIYLLYPCVWVFLSLEFAVWYLEIKFLNDSDRSITFAGKWVSGRCRYLVLMMVWGFTGARLGAKAILQHFGEIHSLPMFLLIFSDLEVILIYLHLYDVTSGYLTGQFFNLLPPVTPPCCFEPLVLCPWVWLIFFFFFLLWTVQINIWIDFQEVRKGNEATHYCKLVLLTLLCSKDTENKV